MFKNKLHLFNKNSPEQYKKLLLDANKHSEFIDAPFFKSTIEKESKLLCNNPTSFRGAMRGGSKMRNNSMPFISEDVSINS